MIYIETFLFITIVWNFVGFFLSICFDSRGFEHVNPLWIYRNYKVNVFGSIILAVLANLICPIGSICYWFYKLCTVGRR